MTAVKSYDDEDSLYQMPEHTGRNILVFSDGTDASGGLFFDEARSNVYKLFRATRCGPDGIIDPGAQLAFYDPGLGSALAAREIKWGWKRWLYSKLSSATGWGITKNIEECYQFLLLNWRPGDRIFLFGFSRGAYTVRCLAGVLGLCGIPTISIGHTTFLRDPIAARKIAREAVRRVYRHGSGAEPKETDDQRTKDRKQKRQRLLGVQRDALAKQFQEKYHSVGPHGSNAIPHFIGVWDTVASVGLNQPLRRLLAQVSAQFFSVSLYTSHGGTPVHSTGCLFSTCWCGSPL